MEWKLNDDRPIWLQLAEQMTRRIITGVYPPGSKLPPVRELAAEAGVNPNTMQRALAELEQYGLIYSQRTSGRFVTENAAMIETVKNELAKAVVESFYKQMAALGYSKEESKEIIQHTEEENGR